MFILKRLLPDVGVKEAVITWLSPILRSVYDTWNTEDPSGAFSDTMTSDIKGRLIMTGAEFNARDNSNMREISFNQRVNLCMHSHSNSFIILTWEYNCEGFRSN